MAVLVVVEPLTQLTQAVQAHLVKETMAVLLILE
jgi:hypothetical protein